MARPSGSPANRAATIVRWPVAGGRWPRPRIGIAGGRRLFEIGSLIAYCRPHGLRDIALPYLADLYERSHQAVHLAVLDGTDVPYLGKLFGHRNVSDAVTCRGASPCGVLRSVSNACHRVKNVPISARMNGQRQVGFNRCGVVRPRGQRDARMSVS